MPALATEGVATAAIEAQHAAPRDNDVTSAFSQQVGTEKNGRYEKYNLYNPTRIDHTSHVTETKGQKHKVTKS